MKAVFLGTGEAFDAELPNNSHLIESDTKLLLDCGYSSVQQMWKYNDEPDFLDAVFISHQHADHYFGLPALLTKMWEQKRKKPLSIICAKKTGSAIRKVLEYAYPTFPKRFEFDVKYVAAAEGKKVRLNELTLEFARTVHSADNLAIRVSDGAHSACYSGDGMFNKKTERLYNGCDLLIHEGYLFDTSLFGHASIKEVIEMARRNDVKCVALTHLYRKMRKGQLAEINDYLSKERVKAVIPKPFDEHEF